MLDLKAKLLAAGIVTQEQVKKVEDEEAARKQRAKEQRERKQQQREGKRHEPKNDQRARVEKRDDDDEDAKAAKREHALVEAERWRKRLTELAAAGKSEQYEAIRGWVLRHRLDNRQITEQAQRFHFMKADGSLSHLTVEPDVQAQLSAGEAALITFMGFNGLEHAVVPKDVALDVRQVRPEWLRSLVGVTDVAPEPPAGDAPASEEPPKEPS